MRRRSASPSSPTTRSSWPATHRDDVTVARYRPDGQLDESFGTEGIVTGIAVGVANDVIIHPEAGSSSLARPLWTIRRATTSRLLRRPAAPDGGPDLSFGLGGQVVTDVGG